MTGRENAGWLVGSLGALAILCAWLCPAAGAATARSADSFVDSIGVAVHYGFTGTPYVDHPAALEQRLLELGVRHVRADLPLGDATAYGVIDDLAAAGIGSTLIVGDPDRGGGVPGQMLAAVKNQLAGAVEAVEGPNEYSTRGGPEWKAKLIAYQQALYEAVKGDPALSGLPVIGPSIVHGDQAELGDVSAWLDYGNVHSYPEGNPPEYRMGLNVERAQLNSGTKPIVATETGYTNAVGWTPSGPGENKPISEAAALYAPRLFFEYFIRHIARSFQYELVDEHPDPDHEEREDDFGLLRNDLSPKPAFTALRNTIALLADPGPDFVPGTLEYTVSEGGATLHRLLLEKRDGTFYLVLWRRQSVWDPDAKADLPFSREPVTVTLPGGFDSYGVYVPTAAATPVGGGGPGTELAVDVGPEATVVAIRPAPPPQPEPEPGPEPPSLSPPLPPELRLATPAPRRCVVPGLLGMRLAAARRRARAAGCALGKPRRRPGATARRGRVVAQHPAPEAVRPLRAKIRLTLAAPG